MEITLNSSKFNETIKSEEKILVDFWATWCGPCMRQAPILEELAGEGYHIGKVDVDQAPDLAGTYRRIRGTKRCRTEPKISALWRKNAEAASIRACPTRNSCRKKRRR